MKPWRLEARKKPKQPRFAALTRRRLARLTQRERQTFDLLCQGLKNQAVADRMHVSLRTVEVHRANISRKLETASLIAFICQLNAEPADDICPSASK
ncbi:Tetrathionate reductase two-component response regulator [Edwardsiella anguillarum]|uniref:Tetrathionate reductase two-component response regulator n=2 Tax=Edwardsiella anguillarum TaxID=1821960 RepID=A0A076LXD4_9GAMM|nr:MULTISPECIES: LuxR C-terminal-related transcriptional regulator [Edwardsiella]GAJ68791.1 tetrathionate reductase two-component response regulator [Edwardsiella piscicida]AIJ10084.1 Tetrathionate reductase two-component response regulator [Edwardsiella anguillarum ET080813]UBU95003.1 LuxR C-terminal-related transcriptional regulator [Edwardsiella sp. LADL05-105]UOU80786.1 LuxR C-terminal-related transcriptional regulator [Edwardsiella anguillarum]WHP85531.1 LuxR C-terminal-related transcript